MIGFYLTIDKNAHSDVALSLSPSGPLHFEALKYQGLHIFNDDRLQIVRSNGYAVCNIGTLIYRNNWHKRALELIFSDLIRGQTIEEILPNTRGQFCLVIHTDGKVLVITDKIGSFPIYKFEDEKSVQISNIFLLLARHNRVSINYQAIAEYLSFDYCFGDTYFNEITRLENATIYQFDPHPKKQVYDSFPSGFVFNKYSKLGEICGMVKDTLVQNLSFLTSQDRVFADLTGGLDTRTIATTLKSMNLYFETGLCGEQVLNESRLASEVAETLHVKHHSNIKITDKDLFERTVNEHFEISSGVPILYHSSELVNYYRYIRQNFDVHITGFAGSQLFDQFLPRLSFFSSKLRPESILEKTYKCKDLINSKLLSESLYYERLVEKMHGLLQRIGSDIHEEVGCLFPVSTFNKYYHGTLAATHNALIPFYCPYLESNIIRLLSETSYKLKEDRAIQRALLSELNRAVSRIMTSHAYDASIEWKGTKAKLRRFKKRVRDFSRQMAYDLRFPVMIMHTVQRFRGKRRPSIKLEEIHRAFWVDQVEREWSNDIAIFQVIDRKKMDKWLARDPYVSKLKAKILYLNRLIDECNPRI